MLEALERTEGLLRHYGHVYEANLAAIARAHDRTYVERLRARVPPPAGITNHGARFGARIMGSESNLFVVFTLTPNYTFRAELITVVARCSQRGFATFHPGAWACHR